LNKSPLARRWFCGMGCAKGDDANGTPAQGGAVSSAGRCDPVAGADAPTIFWRGLDIPAAARSLLRRVPRACALGRSFARRLTRQTARKAPSPLGCGKIGRDRVGRSSVFQRKMRPRSGLLAPHVYFGAVWHPRRCPIPASRGPSGHAPGSNGVGIVVPATTCVARLMIIPILPATRSARTYSGLP
jgi:hypothetical protein